MPQRISAAEPSAEKRVGWVLNPRVKVRIVWTKAWVKDPPYEAKVTQRLPCPMPYIRGRLRLSSGRRTASEHLNSQ